MSGNVEARTVRRAAALAEIQRYEPHAGPPCEIELSDSTSQWGTPPAARRAIEDAVARSYQYPSLYGDALKAAAAAYIGVAPENVVTGCGSDDVIDSTLGAFSAPGDRIAFCSPTFVMVPVFSKLHGLEPVEIPFRDDWSIDTEALIASDARIIYICSPNNPTGSPVSRASIDQVVRAFDGLVIVDEAYAEFSGMTVAADAPGWNRVVAIRTFSKAFGLAGLRAGYGVASATLIREIEKVRGPYTLNRLAETAATVALREDAAWVREVAAEAVHNRDRLTRELRSLGLQPLESAANFLCVPVPDANRWAAALRDEGIAVRGFRNLPRIGDALRIAVAPWTQLERLLAVMRRLAAEGVR